MTKSNIYPPKGFEVPELIFNHPFRLGGSEKYTHYYYEDRTNGNNIKKIDFWESKGKVIDSFERVVSGKLLRVFMTKNIKNFRTRYRHWKLNFLNILKQTMTIKLQ